MHHDAGWLAGVSAVSRQSSRRREQSTAARQGQPLCKVNERFSSIQLIRLLIPPVMFFLTPSFSFFYKKASNTFIPCLLIYLDDFKLYLMSRNFSRKEAKKATQVVEIKKKWIDYFQISYKKIMQMRKIIFSLMNAEKCRIPDIRSGTKSGTLNDKTNTSTDQ